MCFPISLCSVQGDWMRKADRCDETVVNCTILVANYFPPEANMEFNLDTLTLVQVRTSMLLQSGRKNFAVELQEEALCP